MKCQKCDRPATFHITELTGNKPMELHLCEEHARVYVNEAPTNSAAAAASIAPNVTQQFVLNAAADELKEIDQQTCPVCGISFFEFRNKGRLGCPNDYVCFSEQIEPLAISIHGEAKHVGKKPNRFDEQKDSRLLLIQLRRELEDAIETEDYENASKIRDKIKAMS